jgi:glycosyltransferase involved in cell wall biosynthesis
MKVLAIVPSVRDISPGQRYRIEQWESALGPQGVDIRYAPFESERLRAVLYQPGHTAAKTAEILRGIGRRLRLLPSLDAVDLVYIYREAAPVGPAVLERCIRRSMVPYVFDFDDAIFLPNASDANRHVAWVKCPGKVRSICRLAAHVMVGNRYLADQARRWNPNVTVVPTTIDTGKYRVRSRDSAGPPVIGWTGSHTTARYLQLLAPALERLARRCTFRLRVIGATDLRFDGVDVEFVRWRSETEVEDLGPVDIGVMPLPDDPWTRGKCGTKALQYMALGAPAVCSPVGVNTDIVDDGVNGFLASTEDEWVDRLARLVESRGLRERLGAMARATVERSYSVEVAAPRVLEVFQAAVRTRQRRR